MIGVLAVIGILAATLAPNAIRAIERASNQSESASVSHLGNSVRNYVIDTGSLPSSANWDTELAGYTELSSIDIQTNRRGIDRVLILDPASSPSERIIILSNMRNNLNLPTAGNINSSTRFQALWDSPNGTIPSTASWNGWNNWNNVHNAEDFLHIERVNLKPIYMDELKLSNVSINNPSASTTSYQLLDSTSTLLASGPIGSGGTVSLTNLSKGDRIDFFSDAGSTTLIYSYIIEGEDRSFDFSDWIP